METLRSYKKPSFNDYFRSLPHEEKTELQKCIDRCIDGCISNECISNDRDSTECNGTECNNRCSLHLAKFKEITTKSLEDFCDANQHIVPALVEELAYANPSIPYSFFIKASRLPLVAHNPSKYPWATDTTATWVFRNGQLTYYPGSVLLDAYYTERFRLQQLCDDAWQLMDPCCKKQRCKNHCTEASERYNDGKRVVETFTGPFKWFLISTGKEYEEDK